MKYSLHVFRSSIGGDATPLYTNWALLYTYDKGKYYNWALAMIGFSWLLWALNAFFTLIILMNFLIAIVGQSYQNVIDNQMISLY